MFVVRNLGNNIFQRNMYFFFLLHVRHFAMVGGRKTMQQLFSSCIQDYLCLRVLKLPNVTAWLDLGCGKCKFNHWTCFNWQGKSNNFISIFFLLSVNMSEVYIVHSIFCGISKDPREQTKLDNFMVRQLDGTVNEWGWCKQKVCWTFFCSTEVDVSNVMLT